MSTPIKIALDWTPNGNHVGFFVAKARGLYAAAGLEVSFVSPHSDGYTATPASRVESGEALLACTPSETVISFATRPSSAPKPAVKAVAALLQADDSAIVTLASSGIDRPAKLAGKRYASYSARYEGRIVQQLIKADGGSGDYEELSLPHLGLWNTVCGGAADATWVFMGWEGVEARLKGLELNAFSLGDYGIPYGYSPVVIAHPDSLSGPRAAAVRAVLAATAEGYRWAAANPREAAAAMAAAVAAEFPDLPALDPELVKGSVEAVAGACLDPAGRWGAMDAGRWGAFLDWLSAQGLLTTKVQSRTEGADTASLDALRAGDAGEAIPRETVDETALFTNEFLP